MKRNAAILAEAERGVRLRLIADSVGLSYERVRQIVRAAGIPAPAIRKPYVAPVRDRILAGHRIEDMGHETPCWIWTGRLTESGYARFSCGNRETRVHRAAYEEFVGAIPEGKVIDHLCRVRKCVNPDHLEAVSQQENVARGDSPALTRARFTEGRTQALPGGA